MPFSSPPTGPGRAVARLATALVPALALAFTVACGGDHVTASSLTGPADPATTPVPGSPAPAAPATSYASVRLVPSRLSLVPGARWTVDAWYRDSAGSIVSPAATFRSANAAVATVDASGTVVAQRAGSTFIVVTSEGRADSLPVLVATAPASAFAMEVQVLGTPDARLVDVVRQAARRWEHVIVGDLPAQRVTLDAGACADGAPALDATIDDIRVLVRIDSIDGRGGTLGMAGPCIVRSGSWLPAVGSIELDRDDLAWMLDRGTALAVVTHELGHVLGIGTLWNSGSHALLVGSGGDDPRYAGAAGRAGAFAIGFGRTADDGVAVENTGSAGTRDGHWRESVFGDELMTGWAAAVAPMSLLTVRSLQDMGYVVTELAAEPFAAARPSGTAVRGTRESATPGFKIADKVKSPTWTIDVAGRKRKLP